MLLGGTGLLRSSIAFVFYYQVFIARPFRRHRENKRTEAFRREILSCNMRDSEKLRGPFLFLRRLTTNFKRDDLFSFFFPLVGRRSDDGLPNSPSPRYSSFLRCFSAIFQTKMKSLQSSNSLVVLSRRCWLESIKLLNFFPSIPRCLYSFGTEVSGRIISSFLLFFF